MFPLFYAPCAHMPNPSKNHDEIKDNEKREYGASSVTPATD